MNARAQGALMLAVGGVAIRLGLSGAALNYIKGSYVPLLIVAGVITGILGAVTLARALRADADGHHADEHHIADHHSLADAHDHENAVIGPGDDGSGHGHSHDTAPRIAWMLAAPLFAVLLIAPPPLGSFAANRQSGYIAQPAAAWPELPPAEDGAIPLTQGDFSSRAIYDTDLSLAGEAIRLTGFVSDVTVDGFVLTRFALSCCAADGSPINVRVITSTPPPAVDSWVEVTGTWEPIDGHTIGELTAERPIIRAEALQPIPQPAEPYEA